MSKRPTVMAGKAPVYTVLSKAIIVDLAKYRTASVDVFQEIHGKEKELGLPIVWIEKINEYSNHDKIMQSIMCGDAIDLNRIEYFIGRQPTDVEADAIAIVSKMRAIITEMLYKPEPDYTFAKVPDGRSLTDELKLRKSVVINNNGYQMGYKTAKNVWEHAKTRWKQHDLNQDVDKVQLRVNASGYDRWMIVMSDEIIIGCQTIPRWVVEQLAVHQGWI